jgi:hypothetical protein
MGLWQYGMLPFLLDGLRGVQTITKLVKLLLG